MQPTNYKLHPELAERCLAHLAREEAFLQETRACLFEMNESLRKGGVVQMDSARIKQTQIESFADELSAQRTKLSEDLAAALEVSIGEITLTRLAAELPGPCAEKILSYRDRLQPLVAEVHFLSNRNISLVNYCRSYLQRIFAGATGKGLPVTRYGPTGSQLHPNWGTLFVAMG